MIEDNQSENRLKAEPLTGKSLISLIIYSVLSSTLRDSGVPTPLAIMISATVVFLPAYWFPPRPPIRFLRYAIGLEILFGEFVIAFWVIPKLLRQSMPIQLAYAIPSFSFSFLLYFQFKFFPHMKKVGFAKWLFGCLIFALLVAGVVTVLPEGR
jgi:hypothetical protein